VHRRFTNTGGDDAIKALRLVNRLPHDAHPWDDLLRAMAVEHPARDDWWDERDLTPLLGAVRIPVYLGSEWTNVPLHLPGLFGAWDAMTGNPDVRMSILGEHGLPWPWESMHIEALAWFDHWLKGRDTGILDGPPIRYWLPGADEWRTSEVWPPPAEHLELALNPDGSLDAAETDGHRDYRCYPPGRGDAATDDHLTWTTAPLDADLDVVGHGELRLTAAGTATDTAWILLLQDIAPDGTATDVTQGWLRAALREVDEAASTPGRPVLPQRRLVPVPPDDPVDYRIPLVANARRFARGHRIRLTLTSDDTRPGAHAMLLFTHRPPTLAEIATNTVFASSRLVLPVLTSA
jgi:predicted acyl esterase